MTFQKRYIISWLILFSLFTLRKPYLYEYISKRKFAMLYFFFLAPRARKKYRTTSWPSNYRFGILYRDDCRLTKATIHNTAAHGGPKTCGKKVYWKYLSYRSLVAQYVTGPRGHAAQPILLITGPHSACSPALSFCLISIRLLFM